MNTKLLQELRGQWVDVWTVGGETQSKDSGKLVDADEQLIKLETSFGELLYIPLFRVRLIKPRA